MSLTVNEGAGAPIPILPEDTYPAVCTMLVDLGEQYSDVFDKTSKKVLIGWELPGETLDNGETRRISKQYTASLNSRGNLRKDLISWRGRDFTPEELKAFDLNNIVGVPCMISVIHQTKADGKTYANIGGIMKLPKGMGKVEPTTKPIIFDLDAPGAIEAIKELPDWVQERIKASETWKALVAEASYAASEKAPETEDLTPGQKQILSDIDADDGELPF